MNSEKQQTIQRRIAIVSSQCKNWEIGYFASQSRGLAEQACDRELIPDQKKRKIWTEEVIFTARVLRQELLKRFGLVLFGQSIIMNKNCEIYNSSIEVSQ